MAPPEARPNFSIGDDSPSAFVVVSHKRIYKYRSEEAKRVSQINGLGVYKSKWSSGMRHVHLGMTLKLRTKRFSKKRNAL
jgi:hypothetical protein